MIIGIGCTVPEIVNLPGQSGEAGVALDYSLASVCNGENAFSPSQATPSGGVFAATPSGLNINSSTGVVTPVGSTPQAYVITYTVSGVTSTFDLTIKPLDDASFSYSASSFPQNGSDPTPTGSFISGGVFSSTSGLIINTSTGKIDLSASTIGSYTVTYNTTPIGNACPNTSNVSLAIGDANVAQINNVYSMQFDGIDDYVDLGDFTSVLGTTSKFSTSLWCNWQGGTVFRNGMLNFAPAAIGGSGTTFDIRFENTSSIKVSIDNDATRTFTVSPSLSSAWMHIAFTYDGTLVSGNTFDGVKLYINGAEANTLVAFKSINPTINFASMFGFLGFAQSFSESRKWDGLIDEVGIFNTTLTQGQVTAIYNATAVVGGVNKTANLNALSTPPIKWYRMGD